MTNPIPRPNGIGMIPIQFSIIWSARIGVRPPCDRIFVSSFGINLCSYSKITSLLISIKSSSLCNLVEIGEIEGVIIRDTYLILSLLERLLVEILDHLLEHVALDGNLLAFLLILLRLQVDS